MQSYLVSQLQDTIEDTSVPRAFELRSPESLLILLDNRTS